MWRSLPIPSLLLSEVHKNTHSSLQHYRYIHRCLFSLNNVSRVSQALWTTSFSPRPPARGSAETWRCWPAKNRPTPGRNMLTFLCKSHYNTSVGAFHNSICGQTGENIIISHGSLCLIPVHMHYLNILQSIKHSHGS